ncbi:hypothetical protein E1297_30230 [Roseibium sp. RKSG952]|nr:hypothetical protein [Roseibium sp. RKSG952]
MISGYLRSGQHETASAVMSKMKVS